MKLQVGKTYIDAKGNYVKIVGFEEGHRLPYVDELGNGYTEEGHFSPSNLPAFEAWNLIDEASA